LKNPLGSENLGIVALRMHPPRAIACLRLRVGNIKSRVNRARPRLTELLAMMRRDGLTRGLVTLCIGVGQGIALAIEVMH
jgi:hypothetical protein